MAIYQVLYPFLMPWGLVQHTMLHVGFALVIVCLKFMLQAGVKRVIATAGLIISLIVIPYFFVAAPSLELKFGLGLTNFEFAMSLLILAVVALATWLVWGLVISGFMAVALLYFYFGNLVPGPMRGPAFPSADYATAFLAGAGESGVFGQVTPLSANVIFLFILFGGVLSATGVIPMFLELGKLLGRVARGSAAFSAVVGSSLLGTVTGATVANVVITGTFTIPAMKREGFTGEQAAAIEAISSCGGQILPPVMGAGAFIMASFLGVPYIRVAAMALIPAILYYLMVVMAVTLTIRRQGIAPRREPIDWGLILSRLPSFVIPLALIIYLLVSGFSPQTAIIWALVAAVGLSFLRKSNLVSVRSLIEATKRIVNGLIRGAEEGAQIAVVIAAISVIAQVLITAGVGPKLTATFIGLAGSSLLLGLILVMAACIILGFGMPTVAAYSLVAMMMVPTLASLGLDRGAAHFFAFYYAIYAAVTPPIATAVIVGCRLADAPFWSTAWASMRIMIAPLLLPIVFTYRRSLLDFPDLDVEMILPVVVSLLLGLLLAILGERIFLRRIDALETVLVVLAVLAALAWVVLDISYLLGIAFALSSLMLAKQWLRRAGTGWRGRTDP